MKSGPPGDLTPKIRKSPESEGFLHRKSTHELYRFVSTLLAKPSQSDTIARIIEGGCKRTILGASGNKQPYSEATRIRFSQKASRKFPINTRQFRFLSAKIICNSKGRLFFISSFFHIQRERDLFQFTSLRANQLLQEKCLAHWNSCTSFLS